DDDRWLLSLPPAHVGGLSVITRCLLARKTLVLGEGADAETLARDITTHQVTLASLVPTMLYRLLATNWVPPAHLRVVLLGGAPASPSLCAKARGRGIPIAPTYGLTEACSQVATREPDTRDALDVGLPLSAIEVRLQDGVIQLRGEAMMDGYVGQAPLGNAWFSTGDLGCFDEAGRLVVLGRADDRIITGGENVDPQQVELAFAEVSGLDEVCVFGVPDEEWGMRVAIAVVSSLTEDELRRALSSVSVAAYARPRVYARVDEMPRRGIGKRDRRALAQKVAERLIAL
ncbi:MAG: AMP-binding protein, partial [Myxococcota bacterium]